MARNGRSIIVKVGIIRLVEIRGNKMFTMATMLYVVYQEKSEIYAVSTASGGKLRKIGGTCLQWKQKN